MTTRTGPFADELRFEAWLREQSNRLDGIGELARGFVAGRYRMHDVDELWIQIEKQRARDEFAELERIGVADTAESQTRVDDRHDETERAS
jgi:hypothetical protein